MWHAIKTFLLKKYQKTQTQLLLENCKTKERKEINYKYVYYHFSCSCWIQNNLTNDTSTESRYTFLKFSMAHVLWMPHIFFLNKYCPKNLNQQNLNMFAWGLLSILWKIDKTSIFKAHIAQLSEAKMFNILVELTQHFVKYVQHLAVKILKLWT